MGTHSRFVDLFKEFESARANVQEVKLEPRLRPTAASATREERSLEIRDVGGTFVQWSGAVHDRLVHLDWLLVQMLRLSVRSCCCVFSWVIVSLDCNSLHTELTRLLPSLSRNFLFQNLGYRIGRHGLRRVQQR